MQLAHLIGTREVCASAEVARSYSASDVGKGTEVFGEGAGEGVDHSDAQHGCEGEQDEKELDVRAGQKH